MSTSTRRLEVLRAIVIEYVNTKEPVASKAVATSHVHGVSSATIRNDMGVLEDEGLIRQPHTSAGRIPTDAGYRLFVDCLDPALSLKGRERRLIEHGLDSAESLEEAVDRTVRVLAGITGQAAVAEYPDLVAERIRRIELVDLSEAEVLVLTVTSGGRVFERVLRAEEEPGVVGAADAWNEIRGAMNSAVSGSAVPELREALDQGQKGVAEAHKATYSLVASVVLDSLRPLETSRVVTAGAANLARAGVDFEDVAEVLDVLEDHATLLRLLHKETEGGVHVAIGAGDFHKALADVSLISANYGGTRPVQNHVGVIGPTRMDYARSLAAVDAVSRYLSRLLLRRSGQSLSLPPESAEAGEVTE